MQKDEIRSSAQVVLLEAARERRNFIAIAHADEDWQQTVASFALEGIVLTDDDAKRAGRVIAGDRSLAEVLEQVRESRRLR